MERETRRRNPGSWLGPALLVGAVIVAWQQVDVAPGEAPRPPSVVVPAQRVLAAGQPLRAVCNQRADAPFTPVRISVDQVTSGSPVIGFPRDERGVPDVVPTDAAGSKETFAWDQPPGISPGSSRGNVLFNAHTWPDGSALGNRLLDKLDEGDRIVVIGGQGQRLCYRVTDRVEVPVEPPYSRFYEDIGSPQLALIVCSGKRLGPGNWTHRTIWFAEPVPDDATLS